MKFKELGRSLCIKNYAANFHARTNQMKQFEFFNRYSEKKEKNFS